MEKSKQASSTFRRAITTRVEPMEPQDHKACTGVICNEELYELVHFLQSYDVN